MATTYTPLQEVLTDALSNPELRAEWDRTELARTVARWLVGYRAQHGLTQTQLADLLGWKQSVVARLESGEREPSIATLHHLVDSLGTTATISIRPERVDVQFTRPRRSHRSIQLPRPVRRSRRGARVPA